MHNSKLQCKVSLNIFELQAPSVHLPGRDDIYLSICLLGQYRRTRLVEPIFPLIFNERLTFDRTFRNTTSSYDAVDQLEGEEIHIEVVQLSALYERGIVLASYTGSAFDFLYPFPSLPPSYDEQEQEFNLKRTIDFPGLSPTLVFSSQVSMLGSDNPRHSLNLSRLTSGSHLRRKGNFQRSARSFDHCSRNYERPTLSSIYRSTSPNPAAHLRSNYPRMSVDDQDRPPFVVRKLDRDLFGRQPITDDFTEFADDTPRHRNRSSHSRRQLPSHVATQRARSSSPHGRVSFKSYSGNCYADCHEDHGDDYFSDDYDCNFQSGPYDGYSSEDNLLDFRPRHASRGRRIPSILRRPSLRERFGNGYEDYQKFYNKYDRAY